MEEKVFLKKEIINKILKEIKIGESVNYAEFQKLHKKYGEGLSEKDFAEVLGITTESYKKLKNKGNNARILKNIRIAEDDKEKMIQAVLREKRVGELISYTELQELYKKYGSPLLEKDFAEVIGISNSCYAKSKSKGSRVRIKINEQLSEESKIKIIESVLKERKIGELINYSQFQELHRKYGVYLSEEDFAEILGITYDNYFSIKSKGLTTRLLPKKEIKKDKKNEIIVKVLKEKKIGELINYAEFQSLYSKYGEGLLEKDFAEILGITSSSYKGLKNEGKNARILKQVKITEAEKQNIRRKVLKEVEIGEYIDYKRFQELYSKYGNGLLEKDFSEIIGIHNISYRDIKNNNRRASVFNLKRVSEEKRQEIQEKILLEKSMGQVIDYKEFQSLYSKYGEGLLEREFAEVLCISYMSYSNLKRLKNKVIILKGEKISEEEEQYIIKNIMLQKKQKRSINYEEFLDLYNKYGKKMIEKDFAKILGISYGNFLNLKNKGCTVRILKTKDLSEFYEEEVKDLIKREEFQLEVIAFEYDIPMDTILKWKKELETEKIAKQERYETVTNKMRDIEKRYSKLVLGKSTEEQLEKRQLSKRDIEFITKSLTSMRENYEKYIENITVQEKVKIARNILSTFSKLEKFELSMEQVEECISIIYSTNFEELFDRVKDTQLELSIKDARRHASNQLAKAMESELDKIEEISEIENLKAKILPELVKNSFILVSTKAKVQNKIQKIKQADIINKTRNNISSEIKRIIIDLTNGVLDIDKANIIIDEEAKKKVRSRPQNTLFSITEEQERRQILIQIKTVIKEQAYKYTIQNPETAITQIQKLCGGPIEQSVAVVVEQKIKLKEFEEARNICNKFKKSTPETVKYISGLLKQIKSAEITDIILKCLNGEATEKEEKIYYKIIAEELEMEKATYAIRLGEIILGKNKDAKKITFADVWSDERARTFDR